MMYGRGMTRLARVRGASSRVYMCRYSIYLGYSPLNSSLEGPMMDLSTWDERVSLPPQFSSEISSVGREDRSKML